MRTASWVLWLLVGALASLTSCTCGDDNGTETPAGSTGTGSGTSGGCVAGKTACGTTCVDLAADPANCGQCDFACGAGALCCSQACVETSACTFAVTKVEPINGMQSGGEWLTLTGAGFAPGMRVFLGDGRAPTLVIDSTKARIQTPPGPVGATDVKIEVGSQTAVYEKGFEYQSAGLETPWKVIPMSVVRGENPGVTLLQDGRVLIAGGTLVPDEFDQGLASAELFLRATETMVTSKGTMTAAGPVPRWHDSAITLLDGKVLVVGGSCLYDLSGCAGDPTIAHIYDPGSDTFTQTAEPLNVPRAYTRSVLLPDGRVFIASANDPTVEIYDPATDGFTLVPHTQAHIFGFVVRLRDGRVLLGAGDGGVTAAEIFDPETETFVDAGPMTQGRSMLNAHTLPDGRVLVIGGASLSAGGIDAPLASMELFDPKTGTFSAAAYALSSGRCWAASALVRDGTVLVMGGYTVQNQCASSVGTVDQVDPVKGTVVPFDALPMGKVATEWNAVTLLDGSIVAVGGGACGTQMALPEVYFLPGAPVPK